MAAEKHAIGGYTGARIYRSPIAPIVASKMVHQRLFRNCLLLSLAFGAASVAISLLCEQFLPAELKSFLQAQTEQDVTMSEWLVVGIVVPLLIGLVVNFVGLYRFRRNARPWALALTALCLVLNTLMPPTIEAGLATMARETSITFWGAVLAMMYCEPYSRLFEVTSVAKVTPALVLDTTNPYQPPIA